MKYTAEDVLTGERAPVLYDAEDRPLVRPMGFQPPPRPSTEDIKPT